MQLPDSSQRAMQTKELKPPSVHKRWLREENAVDHSLKPFYSA